MVGLCYFEISGSPQGRICPVCQSAGCVMIIESTRSKKTTPAWHAGQMYNVFFKDSQLIFPPKKGPLVDIQKQCVMWW